MTMTLACGPLVPLVSHTQGKAIVMIPAIVLALACGPAFLAKPFSKDCEGMKAPVAADASVSFGTDYGTIEFTVGNTPAPKDVCLVEIPKEAAAAYQADLQFAWADFERYKKERGIN